MSLVGIVDAFLVLVLLAYLVYGYRTGLIRSVTAIAGFIAGGAAAIYVMPLVGPLIPAPEWRAPATIAAAILLVVAGLSIGAAIGRAIGTTVERTPLRVIDRVLGAAANVMVSALVASMVAFGISSLGVPVLSQPIAASSVLRAIDRATPESVTEITTRLRALALHDGIPLIADAFRGTPPQIPDASVSTPALDTAAQSVVRITGNAYSCGQNRSGSGFVVAPGRVITNAHVVAGVDEPIVESAEYGALVGSVVYFDPVDDLAVIAVDDLDAAPIASAPPLQPGQRAVVNGFPLGGPFSAHPAEVVAVGPLGISDIYGENPIARDVYTIAANVQQGESGGPLLAADGTVVGVIFAKGATTPNVGYAMTLAEASPVIDAAASMRSPVDSGACPTG
ncbi:MarP family serine protease [Marisediminicola senii]|uniref:MarP family serine protease n=1 Tax=Marisediminicola senii TaxID=2711233 RepID=UPI0013EB9E3A|nr:MarP family serine protease [Marisediminicola senii]